MRIAMLGLYGIPTRVGGVERMVEEVGARLAQRGHYVRVYCRNHYTHPMTHYRGMEIVRLGSWNTKYTDTFSHTLLSTLHLLKDPVDIAHYHSLGPAFYSALPRLRGMKTILQIHGLEWTDKKWGKLARFLFKYLFEPMAIYFPNRTASDGKYWKEFLEKKYERSVEFIPNGVEAHPASSNQLLEQIGLEPRKYVLFMGRLVPQKGCHYLIEAFRQLETNCPLVFAGGSLHSDDYVSYLESLARDDARIRFVGFVQGELWSQLLSFSQVTVFPSEAEGQSVGLLEAMGFGNCIVASDIPENVEALSDSGLTFRAKDVDDLANRLRLVLDQPDMARDLGKSAARRAGEVYSWEAATDLLERLYQSLLGQKE